MRLLLVGCSLSPTFTPFMVLLRKNVRREFVTGVLSEEELGNKIFIYELQGEYAARVTNLRAYDAVSHPSLQVYPPDLSFSQSDAANGLCVMCWLRWNRSCTHMLTQVADDGTVLFGRRRAACAQL